MAYLQKLSAKAESNFFLLLHHIHRLTLTSALFFREGGLAEVATVGITHNTEPISAYLA